MEVRQAAKLSRLQLSALLEAKGLAVKTYTLCKWETDVSKPTVEAFLAICDICGVRDIQHTFSEPKRVLRLYDIAVSAGSGNYLDGADYEMIEVDNQVPSTADYAVRVAGDSMTPRFVDGQVIFVHAQPALNDGEIGIFSLNNNAYLKKLERGRLISLNPAYHPIPIRAHDDFKVFGKVIG